MASKVLLHALVLHIFDDRVAFERTSDGACLVVSRNLPDGQLDSYVDDKGRVLKELEGGQVIPIDAIFGIYHLLSGPYVALVLESEVAVAVAGIEFRKVCRGCVVTRPQRSIRHLS